MFERLFRRPFDVARHRNAPYAEDRERFLEHYVRQGHSLATVRQLAPKLLLIVTESAISASRSITAEEIERISRRWRRERAGPVHLRGGPCSPRSFRWAATQWMTFMGCLQKTQSLSASLEAKVQEYSTWMTADRGLSPLTVARRCYETRKFLGWLGSENRTLEAISIADIDAFLIAGAARGWCRRSVARVAGELRVFMRFAGRRGWCDPCLASNIVGPRTYTGELLPSGPSWDDVKRLLESANSDRPRDIRDRAIMMLLAVYGLRAGEVCRLRLDDLDWNQEQISVFRPKERRRQLFPLVPAVGKAIIRYLRKVRPHWPLREVFLPMNAPIRPLSSDGIYPSVARRLARLGVELPHRGPHCLRHACAMRLTSKGFSLKEIGDQLGHRRASSTRIYSKVDLAGLREVATMDLGGLA